MAKPTKPSNVCIECKQPYHPGNWKWSAWLCNPCFKKGVTPK